MCCIFQSSCTRRDEEYRPVKDMTFSWFESYSDWFRSENKKHVTSASFICFYSSFSVLMWWVPITVMEQNHARKILYWKPFGNWYSVIIIAVMHDWIALMTTEKWLMLHTYSWIGVQWKWQLNSIKSLFELALIFTKVFLDESIISDKLSEESRRGLRRPWSLRIIKVHEVQPKFLPARKQTFHIPLPTHTPVWLPLVLTSSRHPIPGCPWTTRPCIQSRCTHPTVRLMKIQIAVIFLEKSIMDRGFIEGTFEDVIDVMLELIDPEGIIQVPSSVTAPVLCNDHFRIPISVLDVVQELPKSLRIQLQPIRSRSATLLSPFVDECISLYEIKMPLEI